MLLVKFVPEYLFVVWTFSYKRRESHCTNFLPLPFSCSSGHETKEKTLFRKRRGRKKKEEKMLQGRDVNIRILLYFFIYFFFQRNKMCEKKCPGFFFFFFAREPITSRSVKRKTSFCFCCFPSLHPPTFLIDWMLPDGFSFFKGRSFSWAVVNNRFLYDQGRLHIRTEVSCLPDQPDML